MKYILIIVIVLCKNFDSKSAFEQPIYSQIDSAQFKIDTKHIALNLKFDWQKQQAYGFAEITFSPLKKTNKIALDAGMLTINSISIQNIQLQYKYNGNDKNDGLEIILDRYYAENELVAIKIYYQTNHKNKADPNAIWGSFGKGLRFQSPTSTTPKKLKQIWSSGEPENNPYWFPCNEDIADIHTTEIRATVEKPLMVISNGNLTETIENQDNTRTFHYKTDIPFPNYLVSIVIGEYFDVLQTSKQIPIHNYGYPHEREAVKATTELLPQMLQFLEEKTGHKYPFSQYSQVVVQDYPFPGLVGQNGFSILSDNYIDDYGVHKDFKYLWDGVALQALANQWFGNLLMPKTWDDIWLNNAFAQYFADLFSEKNNGKAEYLSSILPFEKGAVLADWNTENKHPIVTNKYSDIASFTSDNYSKYRGALVLKMLQKEMGEANWWRAISIYINGNAGKQVTTQNFQNAVEKVSGKSFQWFFDQWIYKIGLPKFEISKNYDNSKIQLLIKVKQIQSQENKTDYEQVNYFKGNIDIEIDQKIYTLFLQDKPENTCTIPLAKAPKFVNFNYEETFLSETEFTKNPEEYLYQLKLTKDISAKQKALDKLVESANDSTANSLLKSKIITAFTAEIKSNQYWRYRQYALVSLRKTQKLPYSKSFIDLVLGLIQNEKSWLKASAIVSLGNTLDAKYFGIYQKAFADESDRVINAASTALGKTKSPKALQVLLDLENQPSWKNQNRISALNGLEQLADSSTADYVLKCLADNQSPRWYLATPIWDYPFAAANTLVALGKGEFGYPILFERFKKSLEENDLNDIFQNVQLIDLLKVERANEVYILLKEKFKDYTEILEKVKNYEKQFLESIKK